MKQLRFQNLDAYFHFATCNRDILYLCGEMQIHGKKHLFKLARGNQIVSSSCRIKNNKKLGGQHVSANIVGESYRETGSCF